MNTESLRQIAKTVADELAAENALIDEYLKLTDRPTITRWVRMIETSEPFLAETVDSADFAVWRAEKLRQKAIA